MKIIVFLMIICLSNVFAQPGNKQKPVKTGNQEAGPLYHSIEKINISNIALVNAMKTIIGVFIENSSTDGDRSTLSLDELRKLLATYKNSKNFDTFFNELDKNGNKLVDFQEFLNIVALYVRDDETSSNDFLAHNDRASY